MLDLEVLRGGAQQRDETLHQSVLPTIRLILSGGPFFQFRKSFMIKYLIVYVFEMIAASQKILLYAVRRSFSVGPNLHV